MCSFRSTASLLIGETFRYPVQLSYGSTRVLYAHVSGCIHEDALAAWWIQLFSEWICLAAFPRIIKVGKM
jgi:hypothetical protein